MLSFNNERPRSGLVLRRRGLKTKFQYAGELSMGGKLPRNRCGRNCCDLPLFAWADARRRAGRPRLRAIKYVQSYGVNNPSTAALIAELAGLRTEDD